MGQKKDNLKSILKKFKNDVSKEIKLEKLILFGSYAKGKAKKRSDIDILIISPDFFGKRYFKRSPIFYLMWDYPYDVDIICLTPEELAKKQEQIGVIREAVKEGIII